MEKKNKFLPYGRQNVKDRDIQSVLDVLRSDFLTTGPAVGKFENKMSEGTDSGYAISCTSGTAGLHLATLALGIGEGDLVVVPSITFLATANAPRIAGAEIIFCDVNPETGLMEPGNLQAAIERGGEKIKAVYAVHLGGQSCDLAEIASLAKANDMFIVEDACHALGTRYRQADGQLGIIGDCKETDMAVFSFHPVKTITMGEGGCVTTNNEELSHRVKTFRDNGIVRTTDKFKNNELATDSKGLSNSWYYEMHDVGLNYRASDLQCSLGESQLKSLDNFVSERQKLTNHYDESLKRINLPYLRPVKRQVNCEPAWHLYQVLIDFEKRKIDRNKVISGLSERGVGSQVHYIPVHLQPYYRERYGKISLEGAEKYYSRCLSLPLFPSMTYTDVDYVIQTLVEIIDTN